MKAAARATATLLKSPDARPLDWKEKTLKISIPLAVWANTRTATGVELQRFLDRAAIGQFFAWVNSRPWTPDFESLRLSSLTLPYPKCGISRDEMVFVSNQLNTDIVGGQKFGIRTIWLGGPALCQTGGHGDMPVTRDAFHAGLHDHSLPRWRYRHLC